MMKKPRSLALGLLVVSAALSGLACPPGQQRPGSEFEGSARWAVDLAQLQIDTFAADSELRAIAGARVDSDGRLFANAGSWSLTAFSASRQQKLVVDVSANGTMTSAVSAATSAGIQAPLPAGWINSTDVLELARGLVPAFGEAPLVTFNLTDFGGDVAGKATWAVNTPGGNVLVLFDGSIARKQ
jgi:hypothetical protein